MAPFPTAVRVPGILVGFITPTVDSLRVGLHGIDRVGRLHREVFFIIGLDQRHQDTETLAFRRVCPGTHERLDLLQGRAVVGIGLDRRFARGSGPAVTSLKVEILHYDSAALLNASSARCMSWSVCARWRCAAQVFV